ncbi:MAG: tRNA (adenosine(37)-N6)-threonylcarbamoyltransferase complex ATPase subunit type 1 TsaE [Candidatus Woykebacteria bacterium RBG_16_43_9]|uniref:tRNA threonylcarbamoyladenosine biosynthesis protein TsaE n=1 Tax=Candidatus Woykebacteria bacterium RBG_16_43_9 TaxID=1802596 RepID=A0A1G1WBV5_9BACT|nr:MAG: tRNA (adenosine(37)-N6)-threonylcarbamoyltransferase complex ATPase subunit type 1 TsaE [Candidatus Woykebacteria bacterium RBG_16_43_9]
MSNKEFLSKKPQDTEDFAKNIAQRLKPGDKLALYGNLGAGKTTFIQGLAKGLGYRGKVFSPTFIFVRSYKISNQTSNVRNPKSEIHTLYHIDLYRLEETKDLKNIGIEEFLNEKGVVCAIEWPEKIENLLPKNVIKIQIEAISEKERKFTLNE